MAGDGERLLCPNLHRVTNPQRTSQQADGYPVLQANYNPRIPLPSPLRPQVLDLGKQLYKAADHAAALGAAAAAAATASGPRVVRAQPAWKQQLQEQEERLQQVGGGEGCGRKGGCGQGGREGLGPSRQMVGGGRRQGAQLLLPPAPARLAGRW